MKRAIKDVVYETIEASKKNGIMFQEIIDKTGYSQTQVKYAIANNRHLYVKYRMGRRKIYFAISENPGKVSMETKMQEILERLKNGEVLTQYWKGERNDVNDYGDPYLLTAAKRLWMKGEPIIRRQNPGTRLWEYIYVKQ